MKLIGLLIVVVFFMAGCCSETMLGEHKTSNNKSIREYQRPSIWSAGKPTDRLVFNGKSYIGCPVYHYLEVPEKHLLCFRTDTPYGTAYFHVVPTESDFKGFRIKLDEDSSFGQTFGKDPNDVVSTWVVKIEGDDLYFVEHRGYPNFILEWDFYRLNLKSHTLEELDSDTASHK
jgi:hypothetical protein